MSPTILSTFASVLAIVLPLMGAQVGNEQITITLQTLVIIFSQSIIYLRRLMNGGVTPLGKRM